MNTDRFLTRVWDKQVKKMFYDVYSLIDIEKSKDRLIPMQCYGLSDKTNKLIYEEDFILADGMKYWLRYSDNDHAFILNFKDWYNDDNYTSPMVGLSGILPEQIEILGNYYEHPELLEQNKRRARNEKIVFIHKYKRRWIHRMGGLLFNGR